MEALIKLGSVDVPKASETAANVIAKPSLRKYSMSHEEDKKAATERNILKVIKPH